MCLLFILGLRTCLTSSIASARMLHASVRLAPSTSQRPSKRAFLLPLRLVTPFISLSLSSPRLVRVLAQHGTTPILRAAGTALATGTLPLISLWAFTPVPSCPCFPAHARPPAPPRVHPLRLCPPARTSPRAPACNFTLSLPLSSPSSTSQCPSKGLSLLSLHDWPLASTSLGPSPRLPRALVEHGPSPVPRVVAGQCDWRTQFWFWYLTAQTGQFM
ncbi:hypothetical protein BJV74DRAFT_458952 [Russula compacta]|nr:hypothetical protein BJV74DRAFT_458952 [Russula compacta]